MRTERISALDELDRRLRPALMAFFVRRVRNHAEAEDLTQEVFARLAQGTSGPVESADAYVFQVAANLIRDRARREKVRADYREAKSLEDYLGLDPLDPGRILAGRLSLERLAAGIAGLPEKTRRIFVLYRIENVDKATIAAGYGLTVRAIEQHIQKALVGLLPMMEDEL